MSNSVCTLYEGHYHLGLAALANSLHAIGFEGTIWVGFRGTPPPWVPGISVSDNEFSFTCAEGLDLRFIRLETKAHLTNYKPDFMLMVAERSPETTSLIYLDPDIVVRAPWSFFNEWIDTGVAAVEDVNSPLDDSHPRRAAWRRYFEPHDLLLQNRSSVYANGGFLALKRSDFAFLKLWQTIQTLMAPAVGGLSAANISGGKMQAGQSHPSFCFNKTDQDALNIALMAWTGKISLMSGDAMDFKSGGYVMSHALGAPKPWKKSFIQEALRGFPPSRADKEFWQHVAAPIEVYPSAVASRRRFTLAIASFIGRFYRRS